MNNTVQAMDQIYFEWPTKTAVEDDPFSPQILNLDVVGNYCHPGTDRQNSFRNDNFAEPYDVCPDESTGQDSLCSYFADFDRAAADSEPLRNAVQNGGRLSSDAKPVAIYKNGSHHVANKPIYRKIKPISSGSSGADEASAPSLPSEIFKVKNPTAEFDHTRAQSVPLDGHSAMPISGEDEETRYSTVSSHRDGSVVLQGELFIASSSPENSKNKFPFAPNSRSYHLKLPCEKSADYREKRKRNNEAVKNCREKKRANEEQLKYKFGELSEENRNLKRRLDMAERRAEIAERQKDYLQTVLQSFAGHTKEKVV